MKIITGSTSDFDIGKITSPIIESLANKLHFPFQNYNLDFHKTYKNLHPSWCKLYAVLDSLTQHDNVLWIDSDVIPVKEFINDFYYLDDFVRNINDFFLENIIKV